MSKATDTLRFLAIHNSWRRGDETFGMQEPAEIGAAIDDAVNLLRRYDELEKENALLLADKARLDWLEANHYLVDFINEGVEPTQKGVFICTNGSNSQTAITIRSAIDAAIKN